MVRRVSITTDAVVVRKIGKLLYGDRWQRPLARGAGVSQNLEKTPHGVVVWLVGLSTKHRESENVAVVAAVNGDRVVRFAVGPDGGASPKLCRGRGAVRRAC